MSMFADVVFKRVHYSCMFYVGTVPMFLSFFAVTLLAHYENWDPVMEGIQKCYMLVFRRNRNLRYIFDLVFTFIAASFKVSFTNVALTCLWWKSCQSLVNVEPM